MKKVLSAGISLAVLLSFGVAGAEGITPAAGNINTNNLQAQNSQGNQNNNTNTYTQANAANLGANGQLQLSADASCMRAAIEKRDTAIINGFNAFHAQSVATISTRTTTLGNAWTKTGEARVAANKAAWATWRENMRTNRNTFRSAKTAAWNQFKTDRTACGVKSSAEAGTSGMDTSL